MLSESVGHQVPAALRPFVAAVTGYRHEGLTPSVHRGLPSPYLTLVLALDEPLVLAMEPGRAAAFDVAVAGLHTRPAFISTGTRQHGLQLALTPAGARALLGVPAGALASLGVELTEVIGPVAGELTERVRAASGWAGRFAVLDDVLCRIAVASRPGPHPDVAEAWRSLTAAGGRIPVTELAARSGWSTRRLRERFRAELGLAPQEAARVARFDRARRRLAAAVARGSRVDLAALAVGSGYADQAHMTREWRAHAGLPPRRWVAGEQMLTEQSADPYKTADAISDHAGRHDHT